MVGQGGGERSEDPPVGLLDFLDAVKIQICENEVPGNHDLLFNVISEDRMFSS